MNKTFKSPVSMLLAAVIAFSSPLSAGAASYSDHIVTASGEEVVKDSIDKADDAEEYVENGEILDEEGAFETAGEYEDDNIESEIDENSETEQEGHSDLEQEEIIQQEDLIDSESDIIEDEELKPYSNESDIEGETTEYITEADLLFMQSEGYSHRVGMGGYVGMLADGNGSFYTWGVIDERAAREGESGPEEVNLDDVIFVAATAAMGGAVINQDNKLFVWGENDYGRVGNGESGYSTESVAEPYEVPLDNVSYVATDTQATAAITSDGSLYVWGRNDDWYSIGIEREGNKISSYPTPQKIDAISNAVQVAIGRAVLVLTASGEVYSTTDAEGKYTCSYKKVDGLSNVVSISAGDYGYGAVTAGGEVYTWGDDYLGHLGLCSTKRTTYNTPQKVAISDVKSISIGSGSSLLLTGDGHVYAAGANQFGQLGSGDDTPSSRNSFEIISALSDIDSVCAGSGVYEWTTNAAVSGNGDLYTWGYNSFDQIGLGKTAKKYYNSPEYIGNLSGKWKWVKDTAQKKGFDLDKDGYGIMNDSRGFDYPWGYKIPYERYHDVYGDSYTEDIYDQTAREWGGSCFGMSTTSVLIYDGLENLNMHVGSGETLNEIGQLKKNVFQKRNYKYVETDSEICKLIEKYQIMVNSAEAVAVYKKAEDEYMTDSEGSSFTGEGARRLLDIITTSDEPLLLSMWWEYFDLEKLGRNRNGHAIVINSSTSPEELENGWYRIRIYDCNHPYGGKVDGYTVDYDTPYEDADSRYFYLNIENGCWRYEDVSTNAIGMPYDIGYQDNGKKIRNSGVIPLNVRDFPLLSAATKLTRQAEEGHVNATVRAKTASIRSSNGNELFRTQNGEIVYIDEARVRVLHYPEISNDETSSADLSVCYELSLDFGEYSFELQDGVVALLSSDGDYAGVKTSGTVQIRNDSSSGLSLRSSENEDVNIVLEDVSSGENRFNCISTNTVIGRNGAEISLTGDKLTIQNPIAQKINIHSESNDREHFYNNISVAGREDYVVSAETIPESGTDPDRENLSVDGLEDKYYTGSLIYQNIKVYDNGILLTRNKDYSLTYKNNKNAYLLSEGDEGFNAKKAPSITITGKGNYEGKETVYFKILPQNISNKEFSADDITLAATGKKQKVVPALYWNGKALKNNTEYSFDIYKADDTEFATRLGSSVTEAGQYVLRFTGKGNFAGTRNIRLTVTTDYTLVSKLKICKPTTYVYTGEAITPEPEVKNGKTLLTKDVHYTLSYASNINVGTGYVIVSGVPENGYSGTKRMAFTIKAPKQAKAVKYDISPSKDTEQRITVTCDSPAVFMKGGAKPAITVTYKNDDGTVATLLEGNDYKLSYKNNTAFGGKKAPLAVVTGMGMFKGRRECAFEITEKSLSEVALLVDDVTYKNKPGSYATKLSLTDEDGKLLKAGKDYDKKTEHTYLRSTDVIAGGSIVRRAAGALVEKADIIPVDTVIKVTVNAKPGSGYTGSVSAEYKITKAGIASAKVTIPVQTYTGKPITLNKSLIRVSVQKQKLEESDFEIVSYTNNLQKGTAKVTIRGVGNYGGLKTQTFRIKAKGFIWWWRK